MTPVQFEILRLYDVGRSVAEIAAAIPISPGYVYGLVRRYRPKRKRKQRARTSELRVKILGLRASGIEPDRIRFLLKSECSRQYVYKVLAEV